MIRILLITNIISPYRQILYNAWAQDCRRRGMDLHTAFMARGEPGRRWDPEDYPLNHPHTYYPGLHPSIPKLFSESTPIHVNPGIWWDMMCYRWDIVVIGGYDYVTSAVAGLLPKKSIVRLLWTESNPMSARRRGSISRRIKEFLIGRYDGFVVPGKWAREQILNILPAAVKRPFLMLPNVVDEAQFAKQRALPSEEIATRRRKWGIPEGDRVLLFVGRLDSNKGMDRVIAATADKAVKGLTYLLVGDGFLQDKIQAQGDVAKSCNVKILGHQEAEVVREVMGMSDGLILASFRDCWPLVLVEAAAAGLPLLCSDRVGNCRDIVVAGRNGWVFDVTDPASILSAVNEFASCDEDTLAEMGRESGRIVDEQFRTSLVIRNFNEGLLDLYHRNLAVRG